MNIPNGFTQSEMYGSDAFQPKNNFFWLEYEVVANFQPLENTNEYLIEFDFGDLSDFDEEDLQDSSFLSEFLDFIKKELGYECISHEELNITERDEGLAEIVAYYSF